eukprot:scaffold13793_cov165-Amphora_coffeaeformis.AAC.3
MCVQCELGYRYQATMPENGQDTRIRFATLLFPLAKFQSIDGGRWDKGSRRLWMDKNHQQSQQQQIVYHLTTTKDDPVSVRSNSHPSSKLKYGRGHFETEKRNIRNSANLMNQ